MNNKEAENLDYNREKQNDYQKIKCIHCGKILFVSKVEEDIINNSQKLLLFKYYCNSCDSTYTKFKII